VARWLRSLSQGGGPPPPNDPGGARLARQVAVAQLKVIAEKVERGEANVSDLKQVAIDALAVAFQSARTSRDLTRTANVVRQWLADEQGAPGATTVTAIKIIVNPPAAPSPAGRAALEDGRAGAGSLEAHGLRIRLNGDNPR
jgi:hypothetical protein